MSKNIVINKRDSEGYTPYYPENNAYNVKRTTNDISYIQGNNLLEVMQNIANKYVTPRGEQWSTPEIWIQDYELNSSSSICCKDNFICILTPYDELGVHRMNMVISFDGGKNWEFGHYSNTNQIYRISNIISTTASLGDDGKYNVILIGTVDSSSTIATTYKIVFEPNKIPSSVYMFNTRIDLLDSEVVA